MSTFTLSGPYEPPSDDYESGEGEGYTLFHSAGGQLDYNITDTEIHVRWIEATPQGQGTGTALMIEVMRRHPGREVTTNSLTEPGQRLFDRLGL